MGDGKAHLGVNAIVMRFIYCNVDGLERGEARASRASAALPAAQSSVLCDISLSKGHVDLMLPPLLCAYLIVHPSNVTMKRRRGTLAISS